MPRRSPNLLDAFVGPGVNTAIGAGTTNIDAGRITIDNAAEPLLVMFDLPAVDVPANVGFDCAAFINGVITPARCHWVQPAAGGPECNMSAHGVFIPSNFNGPALLLQLSITTTAGGCSLRGDVAGNAWRATVCGLGA